MKAKINVAVCDDERLMLDRLNCYLHEYQLQHRREFDIDCFQDGDELCKKALVQPYDIVLLDIEMKGQTGFDVAQKLWKINNGSKLIFLTNHDEWIQEGYKYHAFRYIYKYQTGNQLEEAMDSAIKEIDDDSGCYIKSRERIKRYVRYKQIKYVESLGDEICVHMESAAVISRTTMKELTGKLDERFYRCHHQYIVNFDFIKKWDAKNIYLECEIRIPLARSRKRQFLKQYEEWVLKK